MSIKRALAQKRADAEKARQAKLALERRLVEERRQHEFAEDRALDEERKRFTRAALAVGPTAASIEAAAAMMRAAYQTPEQREAARVERERAEEEAKLAQARNDWPDIIAAADAAFDDEE